jgi:hypothetical protein
MAKVTLLATGETATFNDEYAERLIEQGKAVPVGDEPESLAQGSVSGTERVTPGRRRPAWRQPSGRRSPVPRRPA